MSTHTPGPWLNEAGVRQYTTPEGHVYRAAVGTRAKREGYECRDILSVMNPDAEDIANLQLAAAAPDLLAALEYAETVIQRARAYFPKSIKNGDKFDLELAAATIGKAIHKATDGTA